MQRQTDHSAEVHPGGNGQFDVLADGTLLFSKHAEGRFPDVDEILTAL